MDATVVMLMTLGMAYVGYKAITWVLEPVRTAVVVGPTSKPRTGVITPPLS